MSYPFGDGLSCQGGPDATEHHFTGKERDAESGLDYFGARYMTSDLGRFMTADWASKPTAVPYASFGNPQSLNLYAYVGNNPMIGQDKEGHCGPLCVVAAVVVVGTAAVALYVAYKEVKEFKESVQNAVRTNQRNMDEILDPNSKNEHTGRLGNVSTPEERKAVKDGGKAAVALDGAANAVVSLAGAAINGPVETLTDPAGATEGLVGSSHDALEKSQPSEDKEGSSAPQQKSDGDGQPGDAGSQQGNSQQQTTPPPQPQQNNQNSSPPN